MATPKKYPKFWENPTYWRNIRTSTEGCGGTYLARELASKRYLLEQKTRMPPEVVKSLHRATANGVTKIQHTRILEILG